ALYADGGLFDNLPVKPLIGRCDRIIAIHVSPIRPIKTLKNLAQIAVRTFELSVNGNIHEDREQCDLFIAPKGIDTYDILDARHAEDMYRLGYEVLMRQDIPSEI